MFDNAGRKIEVFAMIAFWVLSVTSIVLAFVLGLMDGYLNPAIFFPLLIGGPIVFYISSLILVGFARIVDDSENPYVPEEIGSIDRKLDDLIKEVEKIKTQNKTSKSTPATTNSEQNTANKIVQQKDNTATQVTGSPRIVPLKQVLELSLMFSDDNSMVGYLQRVRENLNSEDQLKLDEILQTPKDQIRETIKEAVKE